MRKSRTYAVIATILAAIIWSSGGLFIKLLPQSAFTILFYRSFYAGLLFIVIFKSKIFKITRLSFLASLFYVILLIAFVNATKLTTAANAIFLQYTAPAFVLLLEPKFFNIKISRVNAITVIVSLLGMSLFFMDQFSIDSMWGIIIAAISGLALTGFIICQRLNNDDNLENSIILGNLWVVLIMMPLVYDNLSATKSEHMMLLFLGLIQIGLGYILFTFGQKILTALESSLIALLEPILNPLWVVLGYGEFPSTWACIGGAIIISALVIRLLYLEYYTDSKYKIST